MPVGVALDVTALQIEGYADRGIGRYVAGYAGALWRAGALDAALLAPELPPPTGVPPELVSRGLVRWDCLAEGRRLTSGTRPVAHHITAPFLHCGPGEPAGLGMAEHWGRLAVPRVTLLHDLIPLRAPRHYLPEPALEARYRSRAAWVATSDLIVTNSEHTRREALDLLGCDSGRVVTVGAGVSGWFSPPDGADEELWRFHFPQLVGRPYVLTVGGSDVRKGTDRAIAALGLLVARGYDLHLLVVGHLTPAFRAELETAARAVGAAGRVVFAGAVDDELLRACYRRAVVSVMPSLAEGAGLPVLESAACATPALASGTTSLGEMAAVAEACFDPTDVDSIASVIAAAVGDDRRRTAILRAQASIAAASTWDAVGARAVAALIRLSAGGPPPGPAEVPLRLAVVGPDGPGRRLAASLGSGSAGSGSAVSGPGGGVEVTFVGAERRGAFGTDLRPASYDHVLYVFDPTAPGWVADVAARHPGWIVIPDPTGPVPDAVADPLVRLSRGVLAVGEEQARVVRARLRPGVARPPVSVTGGSALADGSALAAGLVGVLRASG